VPNWHLKFEPVTVCDRFREAFKGRFPTTGCLDYNARLTLTKGPHMSNIDLISIERIEKAIYLIRGER